MANIKRIEGIRIKDNNAFGDLIPIGVQNIKDGEAQGSLRGINTAQEDDNIILFSQKTNMIDTDPETDTAIIMNISSIPESKRQSIIVSLSKGIRDYDNNQIIFEQFERIEKNSNFNWEINNNSFIFTSSRLKEVDQIQIKVAFSNYMLGQNAFAEGNNTKAIGKNSHAEGNNTKAIGNNSHAEGSTTVAEGSTSHTEGIVTSAIGNYSHAEGMLTLTEGNYSHAEGNSTQAIGNTSHAEGSSTKAIGARSHAQNYGTIAALDNQTALGKYNIEDIVDTENPNNNYAVIIGNGSSNNNRSNALAVDWNGNIITNGEIRNQQGNSIYNNNLKNLIDGSTEGSLRSINSKEEFPSMIVESEVQTGIVQEDSTFTIDISSIPIDARYTISTLFVRSSLSPYLSNIEYVPVYENWGFNPITDDIISYVKPGENSQTDPEEETTFFAQLKIETSSYYLGENAFAEGQKTTASGRASHAEGDDTTASGRASHAEGQGTIASGYASHAGGQNTKASSNYQTVIGKYNIEDSNNTYAFIIGNGRIGIGRSNALAIDWDGNLFTNGNFYNLEGNPLFDFFLYPTGDETDRTVQIREKLLIYGICYLTNGDFYVKNCDMPDNTSIFGMGQGTKVYLETTGSYVFNVGSYCSISNMTILGNTTIPYSSFSQGTKRGIQLIGDYNSFNDGTYSHNFAKISNLTIKDFDGSGIWAYKNDGMASFLATDIEILRCHTGIDIEFFSEYHSFSNIRCRWCNIGCNMRGGNNLFSNCHFDVNITNLKVDNINYTQQPVNPDHSSFTNCTFCHANNNAGTSIDLSGVYHGLVFTACQIWYGKITMDQCQDIIFTNSLIGGTSNSDNIVFSKCNRIIFKDNIFKVASPTINVPLSGDNKNEHIVWENNMLPNGLSIQLPEAFNNIAIQGVGFSREAGVYEVSIPLPWNITPAPSIEVTKIVFRGIGIIINNPTRNNSNNSDRTKDIDFIAIGNNFMYLKINNTHATVGEMVLCNITFNITNTSFTIK